MPLNPSLITGAFGVFSIEHSWFWALLTSGTQALTIKHEESKLSCLRYSSVRFLLVCINGALECSWAPQTPYPHHCCVKRGSLILSGLQILLWGPDCVETGKPTHRRLAGPLSVFCTLSHTRTDARAHIWIAANCAAVTGDRCSLLKTKKGIVRISSASPIRCGGNCCLFSVRV